MPRQRNYVTRSALMRKGGPHIKSKTGQRVRARIKLSEALYESEFEIDDESEFETNQNENGEPEAPHSFLAAMIYSAVLFPDYRLISNNTFTTS